MGREGMGREGKGREEEGREEEGRGLGKGERDRMGGGYKGGEDGGGELEPPFVKS